MAPARAEPAACATMNATISSVACVRRHAFTAARLAPDPLSAQRVARFRIEPRLYAVLFVAAGADPAGCVVPARAAGLGIEGIWHELISARLQHALLLSFGGALAAAGINAVFGSLIAWTFVRYEFPGKRLFHAMIDLPFALPTAVAGIA